MFKQNYPDEAVSKWNQHFYLESKCRNAIHCIYIFFYVLSDSQDTCVLNCRLIFHKRSSSQTNFSTQSRTITGHSSLFSISSLLWIEGTINYLMFLFWYPFGCLTLWQNYMVNFFNKRKTDIGHKDFLLHKWTSQVLRNMVLLCFNVLFL